MISQIIIQTREQSHTNLVNDVHKYAVEKGTTVFKTSDFISHFALEVCGHDLHLCCVSKMDYLFFKPKTSLNASIISVKVNQYLCWNSLV